MTPDTTPLFALLACCGLVLAGVAVGVPTDATTTTANDTPTASVELTADQQDSCPYEPNTLRCIVADSYVLPDGGFIAVYDADGERVFVTGDPDSVDRPIGYIKPGSYGETILAGGPLGRVVSESQTLIAVVFRDTDGDRVPDVPQNTSDLFAGADQPYTTNGTPVTDEQYVVVGEVPRVTIGTPDSSEPENLTVESGDRVELEPNVLDSASDFAVEWTQPAGPSVELTGPDSPYSSVFFTAPSVSSPTTLTFRLRVTDAQNNTGTDTLNVTVEPDSGPSASVDLRGGGTFGGGTLAYLSSVTLSEGGFVTIRNGSLDTDGAGSVIGVSGYLSAGTHENVEITLYDVPGRTYDRERIPIGFQTLTAVAHVDTDDDQQFDFVASGSEDDGPYTENGTAVTDEARVANQGYYQVDLISGRPYERLGSHAENGFYADPDENRLFRYAHGIADEGIESRGVAWPTPTLRQCIEGAPITRNATANTASVEVTVATGCAPQTLTLAVYETAGTDFSRDDNQTLFASTTRTLGPGTYTLTVELPEREG
jgi:hypothetical protein